MYERAMALAAEEAQNKLDRKESTAVALRLKPKSKSVCCIVECGHVCIFNIFDLMHDLTN